MSPDRTRQEIFKEIIESLIENIQVQIPLEKILFQNLENIHYPNKAQKLFYEALLYISEQTRIVICEKHRNCLHLCYA